MLKIFYSLSEKYCMYFLQDTNETKFLADQPTLKKMRFYWKIQMCFGETYLCVLQLIASENRIWESSLLN